MNRRPSAGLVPVLIILGNVGLLGFPSAAEVPKIEDNSFLIEEAYNQEPGIIQHIQTFQGLRQHRLNLNRVAIGRRIQRVCQIDFASVDERGQRLLCHIAIELLQSFGDSDGCRHLRGWTTGDLYVDITHLVEIESALNSLAAFAA